LKKTLALKIQIGSCRQLYEKLNHKRLLARIKKHEGFSNTVYIDKLGNLTIGYGHLIKKKDNFEENTKYTKKQLTKVFEKDFFVAKNHYDKYFLGNNFPENVKEVLIEMIFQIGIQNILKFRKMLKAIKKKDYITASDEMIDSKWYNQTPNRVTILAKIIEKTNV